MGKTLYNMPTFSSLITINDSSEPCPYLFQRSGASRFLYFHQNYGGNVNITGYVKKVDLSTLSIITLNQIRGSAMWNATHDIYNNRILAFGKALDPNDIFRAVVVTINLSNDNVSYILHPNTGDANEFIGGAIDYKINALIVGERLRGGVTTGSIYPNGGGIWIIPLNSVGSTGTWQRVYETPDGAEIKTIQVYGSNVYAAMWTAGSHRIQVASNTNLTVWTNVESYNVYFRPDISTYGRRIGYVIYNGTSYILRHSTDGATWSSVTLTPSESKTHARLSIYGNYALVILANQNTVLCDVFLVNLTNNSVITIATNVSNCGDMNKTIVQGDNGFYVGVGYTSDGGVNRTSYIYKLSFDRETILTLTMNGTPSPASTITLTANVVDSSGTPISGGIVEFYLLRTISQMNEHDGEYIGSATTDTNGNASINYTIPSTASGILAFRAVFVG